MTQNGFDCIVAGAGPAGSSCALFLARRDLKVLLLDKAKFPRDKVCADNKTWICTSIVRELGLWEPFAKIPRQEITGILLSSPGGSEIRVEFEKEKVLRDGPHYNVRRLVFDNFLFKCAQGEENIGTLEGFEVTQVIKQSDFVVGLEGRDASGSRRSFFAKVVVGADGNESAVARSVGIRSVIPERHALCARAYFDEVDQDPQIMELHYLQRLCPGYFWIFPVDNGACNVGVALPVPNGDKNKIDLERLLSEAILSPKFFRRFSKARRISPVGVWGLTLSGKRKRICGHGFLLIGDAANTAVSFAGEGVGPAMRSARIGAEAIASALEKNDFSHESLRRYEDVLWKIISPENKSISKLDFLARHPRVFDFFVRRMSKSAKLMRLASGVVADYRQAARLFDPLTLLKMLLT